MSAMTHIRERNAMSSGGGIVSTAFTHVASPSGRKHETTQKSSRSLFSWLNSRSSCPARRSAGRTCLFVSLSLTLVLFLVMGQRIIHSSLPRTLDVFSFAGSPDYVQAGASSCECLPKHPHVFYISETRSGGSKKYLQDLKTHYSIYGIDFHALPSRAAARAVSSKFHQGDILIFQYLLYTDFNFDDVREIVRRYKLRLIIPIHDKYFLSGNEDADYAYDPVIHMAAATKIPEAKRRLLADAEYIIFPSQFIYNEFQRHLIFPSMVIVPHIDEQLHRHEFVPPVKGALNIGIITEASECKGLDLLERLFQRGIYKKLDVKFFMYNDYTGNAPAVRKRGRYSEKDIYRQLVKDHIHGLLFLNNMPETYSFALTKGINSGLPFLYTNIGAVRERMASEDHSKYIPTDNEDLESKFGVLLDYIMMHAGTDGKGNLMSLTDKLNVVLPKFYDRLFFENRASILERVQRNHDRSVEKFKDVHRQIQPYAIYFPQFHPTPENDANFYEGFTDMVNLVGAKVEDPTLLTPLKNLLGFYDLKEETDIIPTQISLAKSYGVYGFAIYYYWFSDNSITNQHMVFQDVTDRFFEKRLEDFSVFFVYCNEAWTQNIAFDTNEGAHTISNRYDEETITANLRDLVRYFQHDNYRKIDNRPLLFLHHPHEMKRGEIRLLKSIGDQLTKAHGFDGLELVVDGRGKSYPEFQQYYLHTNYKSPRADSFMDFSTRPKSIDYEAYVRRFLAEEKAQRRDSSSVVNSIFTNFDNSVRFYTHDDTRTFGNVGNKAIFITKTSKNCVGLFKEFLDAQLSLYHAKQTNVSKVFLINSWNEWGEQMAMEPSNEHGFAYLEAFQERLLDFLQEYKTSH